ncbi:MAG: DNA replication protein [Rhodospirillales bacterium]|jgi:chromosomal replication initiation ATPase DnaA|nr:DNA replication protein [Rhodospirillales bacterium]
MATTQLPLNLEHRPALSGEDFLLAPSNQDAVAWLDKWPGWPSTGLVIHGPTGSGKTHLAKVFLAQSEGRLIKSTEVLGDDFYAFSRAPACILENADKLMGSSANEEALLHLYNALGENKCHLLLTAKTPPGQWNISLPDLSSRLNAAASIAIGAPDDTLITALLVKQFADRQLSVDASLIAYLIPRMERSFDAVQRLVDAADKAALAGQQKITKPLLGRVLRDMETT